MVEEVGELELELRDELPEGKLQESGGVKNERMSWDGALAVPIWSSRPGQVQRRFSRPRGREPEVGA